MANSELVSTGTEKRCFDSYKVLVMTGKEKDVSLKQCMIITRKEDKTFLLYS